MKWYEKLWNGIKTACRVFFNTFNTLNKIGMILSLASMVVVVLLGGVPFLLQVALVVFFTLFVIFFINVGRDSQK